MNAYQSSGVFAIARVQVREQIVYIGPPRYEHVTAAPEVDGVRRLAGNSLHQINASVAELNHLGMRPPVTVVIAGLRTREAHRRPRVDQQYRLPAVLLAQIIGRGNTGDAGTDDRDLCSSRALHRARHGRASPPAVAVRFSRSITASARGHVDRHYSTSSSTVRRSPRFRDSASRSASPGAIA